MRIRLDLDPKTTERLVAIALAERRSASLQAEVLLEWAVAQWTTPPLRADAPDLVAVEQK
jgi:hypothetical protein